MKNRVLSTIRNLSKSLSAWLLVFIATIAAIIDYIPAYAAYLPSDWVKYVALASLVAKVIQKSKHD